MWHNKTSVIPKYWSYNILSCFVDDFSCLIFYSNLLCLTDALIFTISIIPFELTEDEPLSRHLLTLLTWSSDSSHQPTPLKITKNHKLWVWTPIFEISLRTCWTQACSSSSFCSCLISVHSLCPKYSSVCRSIIHQSLPQHLQKNNKNIDFNNDDLLIKEYDYYQNSTTWYFLI